jgi:hypothetical protein
MSAPKTSLDPCDMEGSDDQNCKTGVRPLSVEAAGGDARATLWDQQPCCSQSLGAANRC